VPRGVTMFKKNRFVIFFIFVIPLICGADLYDWEKSKDSLDSIISLASYQYKVPEPLIRAIIKVESNFDHKAVSHAGAEGLMQLMPSTAKKLGVKNSFSIRQNVLAGTRYFRELLNEFRGDLELAIAAYNAGTDIVKKFNKIPPYKETQKFVQLVLKYYKKFELSPS